VLEPLLFYVLHRASNEIADPKKLATFKMFLLDEAWLFIKNETIRNYVVQAQKTWRKHNAAMILATQSIKELEESGMLAIVAESCPTKIFLANPEMNRDVYREAFHLNDTELDLIAGLVPPGQMLIRKAQTSKKVQLNVDSVSHWMATNNARDNLKKRDYFRALRYCRRPSPSRRRPSIPAAHAGRINATPTAKEICYAPSEIRHRNCLWSSLHRHLWRRSPRARCNITRRTLSPIRAKVKYTTLIEVPTDRKDHGSGHRRQGLLDCGCG
jgi:hypothetical protein